VDVRLRLRLVRQQLKCLTVTDEWTREALAIVVNGRIRSGRVIEVLSRLVSERGTPRYLRSDNGPEFVARAPLKWIADERIETALTDPGKPLQNGVGESFNGKFRDECLSLEWFPSRAQAILAVRSEVSQCLEIGPQVCVHCSSPGIT
jgi:putative transposase